MSSKLFVCLANSKKHGGRCLAGIEVERDSLGKYRVVTEGWDPKWIRPVSLTEYGEIPTAAATHLKLMDVIEMDGIQEARAGYQSENVIYKAGSLRVVDQLQRTQTILDDFAAYPQGTLFGNRGKAVHIDRIDELDHSLMLVEAEQVRFHREVTASGSTQIRASFEWGGNSYDLPITDPEFEVQYLRDPANATRFSKFYFTLSLGLEYGDFHYKLIAAVIGV